MQAKSFITYVNKVSLSQAEKKRLLTKDLKIVEDFIYIQDLA